MELHAMVVPLCALYLVFSSFVIPAVTLNSEGLALLSFKAAMKEDPENVMANWNSSDTDPCSWSGITCQEGNVVAISLPRKGLFGYLPFSLGSLTSLRHINLRNNRLQGSLPAGLFAARSLQSLVLYSNSLSGPLPPELGNLFYLQILDLSQNSLENSIPASLLQCKRLRVLDLSHNNFASSLPAAFGNNFTALERLSLTYNRLNGSIPNGIGDLSGLRGTADFSHNQFAGAIPASLGNLPEKVYIDLSFNNLSGPVPQNGALVNRGPTAFVGNPGLCGPPLKNPCPSSSGAAASSPSTLPTFPRTHHSPTAPEVYHSKARALNKTVIIAIVVGDVVAIVLMAVVFFYCYRRVIASKNKEESERTSGKNAKRCSSCLGKDEYDTISETVEQSDLIPLDKQVHFDLDDLLKASAFILGKSGIGIVYKVVLEDGLAFAVRRLGDGGLQKFKDFQMEVEAIGKVRHPNIVCLRAYYWSMEEKLLIYDYIPNGNLSTAIHGSAGSSTSSALPWDIRLQIMKGVAKGLAFLHEFSPKKYVHGDLNPNNVLLGQNMEPYISDFGLGHLANVAGGFPLMYMDKRANQKSQSPFSDIAVSPISSSSFCYQGPEVAMKTAKPSQKWDVYSYGVMLLEIISGRSPIVLMDNSNMDLVQWIQQRVGARKPLIDILDPCLASKHVKDDEFIKVLEIALECVQANPERRPPMKLVAEALEMLTSANS